MDFPYLEYRHLAYGEIPAPCDFEDGLYWIDLARDAAHTARHWRREHRSLARYLEPYRRPHVFADFDWSDPRPFLQRLISLGPWAGRALRRQVLRRFGSRLA